jgi:hypothetical protein
LTGYVIESKINLFSIRPAPVVPERSTSKHASAGITTQQAKADEEFLRYNCIAVSITQVACEVGLFEKRRVVNGTRRADDAHVWILCRFSST